MEDLYEFIQKLHLDDAYHIKRGFRLSEASDIVASNHLVEEAVELQAEIIEDNYDGILAEAADLVSMLIHVLVNRGIPLCCLEDAAIKKLTETFSIDAADIISTMPGLTRRNRSNS
jgi:phosphoribosyl-ATP pyrophosphohydrolase